MRRILRSIARVLGGGVLVIAASTAHASTITVTSTADDYDQGPNGNCTLREAVIAANTNTKTDKCAAGGGADTIVIPAGIFTLTIPGAGEDAAHTGDLDLTAAVTITGAGVGATVIDVGGLDNGVEVRVKSGTSFLSNLTIRNAGGVGIANRGSKLNLTDVSVEDSTGVDALSDPLSGGAIYQTNGTLTASRVGVRGTEGGSAWMMAGGVATLDTCTARDADAFIDAGGGLTITGGDVSVTGSMIGDESADPLVSCSNRARSLGGGVYVSGGRLELADSVVAGNCASLPWFEGGAGGALAILGGSVHLSRTRVVRNIAWPERFSGLSEGGGILLRGGSLVVEESRISQNLAFVLAGGIAVEADASADLERSSVDGNAFQALEARLGVAGRLLVRDSTITGDPLGLVPAPFRAWGGVGASGAVTIVGSTIQAGSDPDRIVAAIGSSHGAVSVKSSIVEGACEIDSGGSIASAGYNLGSDPSCALGQPSDLVGVNPHLAPLGFYGGPTPTMPPLPGSPAIESGDPDGCTATDQRGFARPQDGDLDGTARCDRGAVEVACSGIDGGGAECVPLACGAVPRSSNPAPAALLPLLAVCAAAHVRRAGSRTSARSIRMPDARPTHSWSKRATRSSHSFTRGSSSPIMSTICSRT